ncbi:MAG: D-alanine--D-alanine ligase family protein [Anaerolineales bacterium]
MMSTDHKLRVAVLFGGRSGEHDVSLMSARSLLSVLDPQRYELVQIGITPEGKWLTGEDVLGKFENGKVDGLQHVIVSPNPSDTGIYILQDETLKKLTDVDVFFPVLHGTFGEDGTIQGLFELAGVAYVGAGVVGSSVGMDKGVFKDVMVANQIPVVDTMIVLRAEIERDIAAVIEKAEKLGDYPLFAKPANLGSSVGITKCHNRSDLQEGLMEAASFDRRVLIQQGVKNAREIEVGVLGNNEPVASVPGEVLPSREFYSYEAKYVDGTSDLQIPAQLPDETAELIRDYALRAYKAIDCAGMARVDFLLEKDTNRIYLNELNSLPGFTKISMYPKLWEASGLPYTKLVDCLIELAMERKAERDRTSYTYRSDT